LFQLFFVIFLLQSVQEDASGVLRVHLFDYGLAEQTGCGDARLDHGEQALELAGHELAADLHVQLLLVNELFEGDEAEHQLTQRPPDCPESG